ncbi:hypothetical protein ABZ714_13070 [Streptomyces sp. NPDC006798]|uniref:hypothetical protein n=1 Tax=Streptomyces sp. NPDC006798 TaxID=3155462 RepID=UPI0033E367C5
MSLDRNSWTTMDVRAEDLRPNDVALIGGRWREVFYRYCWNDDPAVDFLESDPVLQQVRDIISRSGEGWVAVGLHDEHTDSDDEPGREILPFTWCDLVTVQTKVILQPQTVPEPPAARADRGGAAS